MHWEYLMESASFDDKRKLLFWRRERFCELTFEVFNLDPIKPLLSGCECN